MALTLYVGANDNLLTLIGLQNDVTDAYLNSATVSVTVIDADNNNLSGVSWPLTMSYVTSSNGNYRATLTDTLSATLSSGASLTAKVTANAGAGLSGYWEIPITTATRTT